MLLIISEVGATKRLGRAVFGKNFFPKMAGSPVLTLIAALRSYIMSSIKTRFLTGITRHLTVCISQGGKGCAITLYIMYMIPPVRRMALVLPVWMKSCDSNHFVVQRIWDAVRSCLFPQRPIWS